MAKHRPVAFGGHKRGYLGRACESSSSDDQYDSDWDECVGMGRHLGRSSGVRFQKWTIKADVGIRMTSESLGTWDNHRFEIAETVLQSCPSYCPSVYERSAIAYALARVPWGSEAKEFHYEQSEYHSFWVRATKVLPTIARSVLLTSGKVQTLRNTKWTIWISIHTATREAPDFTDAATQDVVEILSALGVVYYIHEGLADTGGRIIELLEGTPATRPAQPRGAMPGDLAKSTACGSNPSTSYEDIPTDPPGSSPTLDEQPAPASTTKSGDGQ